MADITLQQMISICGEFTSISGSNYTFACPICRQEGHDKSGDNVVYNANKHVFKCFNNDMHSKQILDMINKVNSANSKIMNHNNCNQQKQWELNASQYVQYMMLCNDHLLNDIDLLQYIYDKRRLTPLTLLKYGVGFDPTENTFVIPIYSVKYDCIIDFELRKYGDKKQIRRVGGGCSTIARITNICQCDTLYITEGFIDGLVLWQWLTDKNKCDFNIVSCSSGVSSLLSVMDEIDFTLYNNVKLMLDNDDGGDKATQQIIAKYPFVVDGRQFLRDKQMNDICDYYTNIVRRNK